MPIQRDEVIAALASVAAPLGPLTTIDERLDHLNRWVAHASPDALAVLASIIDSPPRPRTGRFLQPATVADARTIKTPAGRAASSPSTSPSPTTTSSSSSS